jgi:ABC-type multidrug transport system fused ATPase/permease subunit
LEQFLAFLDPREDNEKVLWIQSGTGIVSILISLELVTTLLYGIIVTIRRNYHTSVLNVLMTSIFVKAANMGPQGRSLHPAAKLLNNINVDTDSIGNCFLAFKMIWNIPLRVGLGTYSLAIRLGVSIWPAYAVVALNALYTLSTSKWLGPLFGSIFGSADLRITAMREAVKGMKIIKYFGLEDTIMARIQKYRTLQINALRSIIKIMLVSNAMDSIAPLLMPAIAYSVYSSQYGRLLPSTLFSTLYLFKNITTPMTEAGYLLQAFVNGKVAFQRVTKVFEAIDEEPTPRSESNSFSVEIENATWNYPTVGENTDAENNGFKLTVDQLNVEKSCLVGVVGKVGSGKTSLFNALLGGMNVESGSVCVNGTIALSSQKPYLFSGSIKENILFGAKEDTERLNRVLQLCSLADDLNRMPAGIETKLGENGTVLSGGQIARVSLARAMYQNSDIYLLDDPVAALDTIVGKHIFDNAIKKGLLAKTVFFCTQQLHFMSQVDKIIVLCEGKIQEMGSYQELLDKKGLFAELMESYVQNDEHDQQDVEQIQSVKEVTEDAEELMTEEKMATGNIDWSVYKKYIGYWGPAAPYLTIVSILLIIGATICSDLYLAYYSSNSNITTADFILFYCLIGLISAFFYAFQWVYTSFCVLRSAVKLHNHALSGVFQAPMDFFDSNPTGRILNRFSSDVLSADLGMPNIIIGTIFTAIGVTVGMVLVAQSSWIVTLVLAGLLIVFYSIYQFFQKTNISMKRLSSVMKSPLDSFVSESIEGMQLIKSFGKFEHFQKTFHKRVDEFLSTNYLKTSVFTWVNLRLRLLTTTVTLVVMLISLFGNGGAATVGLALVSSMSLSTALYNLLLSIGNAESEMNSIERLLEYASDLPREAERRLLNDPDSSEWPLVGHIQMSNVEIRYPSRPDVAVIKDLDLEIRPGEKVGICGRTGSGKSTLVSAMFRIMELSEGSITIDGKDLKSLGLHILRTSLTMIPQEPMLFEGTIRSNLDPESQFMEDDIWNSLKSVGLYDFVSNQEAKLDYPIETSGGNLSFGQKQLICIARAILKKPRILLMDEASSAVDQQTDELIQKLIHTDFKSTTVISIAHRLNTIAAFDKVLVLQDGMKIEFDSPKNLLNRDSEFARLVEASGPGNSQAIRDIANSK